jgi:SpoVK/Ycf46/Vps4 family AAA+-type ATPase
MAAYTNMLFIFLYSSFLDAGKTLLAKSLSHSMIVLHSTDVARSAVGQGEKAVLEAFERARQRTERVTVIFIDEFQALFTDRGTGSSSRVTTTLFHCMDNLTRWHNMVQQRVDDDDYNRRRRRVVVLAATNTPWMIDAAFLRPGRFDRTIYVGLPSRTERLAILDLHLQTMRLQQTMDEDDRLSEHLSARTDNFSGADLAALCRAAAVQCLLEDDECDGSMDGDRKVVQTCHFEAVLEEKIVGPSSDAELVARIEAWQQQRRRRS